MNPKAARGRGRSLATLLVVVVVLLLFGLSATQALALPAFNVVMNGVGPCESCHTSANVHPPSNAVLPGTNTNHESVACATCHNQSGGTADPPLPSACVSCHAMSAIMRESPHINEGCASTAGCHGVAPVTPTIAIDTVKPSKAVRVKTKMTLSGGVTPVTTAAKNVAWVVQLKKGSKWIQSKAGTAPLGLLGGAMRFSFKYQPKVKGSYRAQATFVNSETSRTTSRWVAFKAR
jgi:hypothetical protein